MLDVQNLTKSKDKRVNINREYFNNIGKQVKLFKGVDSWFDRINKYGESHGITIEHYIISSGLKEIIEGNPIAKYIKRIYGSSYLYTPDGVAE